MKKKLLLVIYYSCRSLWIKALDDVRKEKKMIIEDRLYSPKEVITKNGGVIAISLSALYAAIERGEIPGVTIGNRKMIQGKFLRALVDDVPVIDRY